VFAFPLSRFLPIANTRGGALDGWHRDATIDQVCGDVRSDEAAEKVDEADNHGLECCRGGCVSVGDYQLGYATDVRFGPRVKLKLLQPRVIRPGLRESAREKRVTSVGADPSRELAVEMVTGFGCGAGRTRTAFG
jgi:hypothetical protein